MPAVKRLGSTAALKYSLGFKSGSLYVVGFKEPDGQKRDLGHRSHFRPNYRQCFYVLLINRVIFVLKMEDLECQLFKISRFSSENFIFYFTIHIFIADLWRLNLYT